MSHRSFNLPCNFLNYEYHEQSNRFPVPDLRMLNIIQERNLKYNWNHSNLQGNLPYFFRCKSYSWSLHLHLVCSIDKLLPIDIRYRQWEVLVHLSSDIRYSLHNLHMEYNRIIWINHLEVEYHYPTAMELRWFSFNT